MPTLDKIGGERWLQLSSLVKCWGAWHLVGVSPLVCEHWRSKEIPTQAPSWGRSSCVGACLSSSNPTLSYALILKFCLKFTCVEHVLWRVKAKWLFVAKSKAGFRREGQDYLKCELHNLKVFYYASLDLVPRSLSLCIHVYMWCAWACGVHGHDIWMKYALYAYDRLGLASFVLSVEQEWEHNKKKRESVTF